MSQEGNERPDLSPIDLSSIGEYLNKEAENNRLRIENQRQQLEYDYKLNDKTLDIQQNLAAKAPDQRRMFFNMIFWRITIGVTIILAFFAFCLAKGYKDVVMYSLYILFVIASNLFTYFITRRNFSNRGHSRPSGEEDIQDAIIE